MARSSSASASSSRQPSEADLTEPEAELLNLVLDLIIPGDEDAGAREAGVIYYIDRQLAGTYQHSREAYRSGLKSVESACAALHGKSFSALDPTEQTQLLERLEQDDVPRDAWSNQSPSSFFGMVVDHAMQGFYGSPIHGGNKDFASYKMLGIELPIDYEGRRS